MSFESVPQDLAAAARLGISMFEILPGEGGPDWEPLQGEHGRYRRWVFHRPQRESHFLENCLRR